MAENKILPGSTEKLGATYDGKGVNFALFPKTRQRSSFACSMKTKTKRESNCRIDPKTASGRAICPMQSRECATAIAWTDRTIPTAACALIRTSC